MPESHENIADDMDLDLNKIKEFFDSMDIYKRQAHDCPLGKGNWIVDLYQHNRVLLCIKLPLEATQDQIYTYCKPLLDIYCH